MQNKKLSLIMMLILILVFFATIMAYLGFSNGGEQKRIAELENNDKILNEKLDEMKLRTDEWDKIINGTTELDLGTGEAPATETPAAGGETPVTETPATETPVVNTPPAEEPKEETPAAKNYSVKASNLNMRANPSSTGSVVRALPNGEKLTGTGKTQQAEGYLWIEVKDSKGNTGWAAQDFLQ